MNNVFVDIEGFEGLYQINAKGEILDLKENELIEIYENENGKIAILFAYDSIYGIYIDDLLKELKL